MVTEPFNQALGGGQAANKDKPGLDTTPYHEQWFHGPLSREQVRIKQNVNDHICQSK